jgi:hypothetical protein
VVQTNQNHVLVARQQRCAVWVQRRMDAADSSDEEALTLGMSEAAKFRVRNRAMRKARETAAMKEVMREEQLMEAQNVMSTILPVLCVLLFACWFFPR